MPVAGSRSVPTMRTSRSPASLALTASTTPAERSSCGASSVPPGAPTLSMGTPTTTGSISPAYGSPPYPVEYRVHLKHVPASALLVDAFEADQREAAVGQKRDDIVEQRSAAIEL